MPPKLNRPRIRAVADANPNASYAELARILGYCETSVARILRYEFFDERNAEFVIVEDFDDFRRGASFSRHDFLTSCWGERGETVWPDGLRVRNGDGHEYVIETWRRKRTLRQRLVNDEWIIEPVSCRGVAVKRRRR